MSSNQRIVFGASLVLNAFLIIALIFIFINRPNETNMENSAIAQIESTTASSTANLPTQTPIIITVVATPTDEPVTDPTEVIETEVAIEPTGTAVPTETLTPTQTAEPTIEPSPTIEPTPTPEPAPTEAVFTGPDWLRYTNQFRAQAGLPLLTENQQLSVGATNHSYYMVVNSSSSHNEDPSLPGYTDTGLQAGKNGNIAVSGVAGTTYYWPIEYWISAAFHTIPMLDPALTYVGYGEHSDASSNFGMAATMDVKSGLREDATDPEYPIMFPRDGGQAWVTSYSMPEFPNTATSCSGYQKPTGAPIILMLGNGENTPQIYETRLSSNGNNIPHCVFDETNYYNPDSYWQNTGRTILDNYDSVVILPRSSLSVGQEYSVYVNNGGEEIEWSFTVVENPLLTENISSE